MVFKYQKDETGLLRKTTLRPVADVSLKKQDGGWFLFHPYIDSGADITLIPLSIGKAIGLEIDKSKIQDLGGVGGGLKVIYTKVKMKIDTKEFWASLAWAMTENVPQLLGRADVFNKFKITFDEAREEIIFA